MYRPKPHILISIAPDGSGSVKQYDNYATAKVAYNALPTGTISAFIYAKPNKSLAFGAIGSPPPVVNKLDFVPSQNATAIFNVGNRDYTVPHPSVAAFGSGGAGWPGMPPLPRLPKPDDFDPFSNYNQWVTFCRANPLCPQCTTNDNPAFNTYISSRCEVVTQSDAYNESYTGSMAAIVTRADGLGETFEVTEDNAHGCWYPAGYVEKVDVDSLITVDAPTKVIMSLDYSGTVTAIAFRVQTLLQQSWRDSVADGSGNWISVNVNGIFDDNNGNQNTGGSTRLRKYLDGEVPYKGLSIGVRAGYPPSAGYPVTYKVAGDDTIHSGRWDVFIADPNGNPPTAEWTFVPSDPNQPPPDPCELRNMVGNPATGTDEYPCDTTTTSIKEEETEDVIINAETYITGDRVRYGMSRNGVEDWGPWGAWVYTPIGNLITEDEYNYYKSDGVGGYTTESKEPPPPPPPCEDSGLHTDEEGWTYDGCNWSYTAPEPPTGYEGEEAYITIPTGASVLSATRVRPVYASGAPGEWTPWNYTASGTLYGSDSSYNYYSDGAGGYTSEPISPPPCDSYGTNLGVDPNNSCDNLYADGTCGTYTSSNGSCDPPPPCDSAGYHYSNNGPYFVNADPGCGSVEIGYYYENVYADGSCGTYTTEEYTYNSGDFTTCNGYIYSVDSAGNISQRPECEDSSLYSGQSGWSYDGCHWSYSEPCPSAGGYAYNAGDYNYYHDGACGYYQGEYTGSSCEVWGISTGQTGSEPINIDLGCGTISVGNTPWEQYHDGTCGTYTSYGSPTYDYGYGSYLGYCNGFDYYSDGGSGYYN